MEGKKPERHPLFTKSEKYNEFVEIMNSLQQKYDSLFWELKSREEKEGHDFVGSREFKEDLEFIRGKIIKLNVEMTKIIMKLDDLKRKMKREN